MTLYETGRLLGIAVEVSDICQVVLDQAVKAVPGCDAGVTALFDPANGNCDPIVGFGLPTDLPVPFPINPDSDLSGNWRSGRKAC